MFKHTAAALLALAASVPFVSAKDVFAHMIVSPVVVEVPCEYDVVCSMCGTRP